MTKKATIVYTITDEAPALATHSFLPIIKAFTASSNIDFKTKDISLAARILATFSDILPKEQQVDDALAELKELLKKPEANIIKLPNISASIPQLTTAIKELQAKGYKLPDYPESLNSEDDKRVLAKYDKVRGSAVNPILREGNSDRRVPKAVKNYVKKNPHSMGPWKSTSKTHVSTMKEGDFAHNEKSITITQNTTVSIIHIDQANHITLLKDNIALSAKEIIDAAKMSKKALVTFLKNEMTDAKKQGTLFSIHLKATMMKVSDPIIFGHAVSVFFEDILVKYGKELVSVGVDVKNGLGNLLENLNELPKEKKAAIKKDIANVFDNSADLAMVNSEKGITNLHVPSDTIIDASMPAMIRNSGQMFNREGGNQDTKAVIPDSSYASIYQTTIDYCKKYGAFDPVTMGTVSNIGLMAQKAEEYGSHDKTFEIPSDGIVQIINSNQEVLIEHTVEKGDIWRMCQTKDAPIQDWIKLAINRAKASNNPTVFWLDDNRAHDAEIIKKLHNYLPKQEISNLNIRILSPKNANLYTLDRVRKGKDTIAVTGNVLRDYLTDLFPILELGTSAKMLSIVPLMNGGGLFETGAGGSAPKHVDQLLNENHLRWDSLGEFLALAVSLEHLGTSNNNSKAIVLAQTLDTATDLLLNNKKSPSRKVGELDNRGSHFYLALYWAKALAAQNKNLELQREFSEIAEQLTKNEQKIVTELLDVQGKSVSVGGYYLPTKELTERVMRPSQLFKKILETV